MADRVGKGQAPNSRDERRGGPATPDRDAWRTVRRRLDSIHRHLERCWPQVELPIGQLVGLGPNASRILSRARQAALNGATRRAEGFLIELLDQDENARAIHVAHGGLLAEAGEWDDAAIAYRCALRIDEGIPEWLKLSSAERERGGKRVVVRGALLHAIRLVRTRDEALRVGLMAMNLSEFRLARVVLGASLAHRETDLRTDFALALAWWHHDRAFGHAALVDAIARARKERTTDWFFEPGG
jgi:hypothetical protein